MANRTDTHGVTSNAGLMGGLTGDSLDYAERAYRSWLQGAESVQATAMTYWPTGGQKGTNAMADTPKSETAAEAFGVQTRYATEAIQDFLVESGKVVDQLVTLGVTAWGAAPPHAGGDTQAAAAPRKRATRRA